MKPAERTRLIANTTANANAVVDMIRDGNLRRLQDAQPGLRAASYDDDLVSGNSVSDPTGNSAGHADPTVSNLHDFDVELEKARKALDAAAVVLRNYGPPRRANEADRLALQRANTKPEPCCENHATITEPHGDLPLLVPSWKGRNPSDVGGRLPKPMLLCRWCVDFVISQGVLPSKEQLEARRDGRRVKVKATGKVRRAS